MTGLSLLVEHPPARAEAPPFPDDGEATTMIAAVSRSA